MIMTRSGDGNLEREDAWHRIETEGGVSDDASREGRFPFSLVVLPVPAKYSLSQQAGHRRVSSCLKDM
jgi:hypothetical protein